jgi:hypothetical protein
MQAHKNVIIAQIYPHKSASSEVSMAILAATDDDEIVCHDDFGVIIVESDFDSFAYQQGVWWNIDNDGYLADKVTVH